MTCFGFGRRARIELGWGASVIGELAGQVSVQGKPRPPLGPGDCFGEIALLRGIPRTATVVAGEPLRTMALDREAFLVAITGNSLSSAAADALVTERLAARPGYKGHSIGGVVRLRSGMQTLNHRGGARASPPGS